MAQLEANELAEAVIARMKESSDPRFREIMTSLVRHAHAFVQEVQLTGDEWMKGIEFLNSELSDFNAQYGDKEHYFFWYGSFYAAQAHFQAGGSQFAAYHARIGADLMRMQTDSGRWLGSVGPGDEFAHRRRPRRAGRDLVAGPLEDVERGPREARDGDGEEHADDERDDDELHHGDTTAGGEDDHGGSG